MAGPLDRAYVEILPDFTKFNAQVVKGVDNAMKKVEKRVTRAVDQIEKQFAAMSKNIEDIDATVDVDADTSGVTDDIEDAIERADKTVNVKVDISGDGARGLGDLEQTLGALAGIRLPIGPLAAFGAVIGAAAATAAELAAELAPAVGIVAGLPSVIGVGAAAMSTLQIATLGVGDAFVAAFDDAEAFDAAIENLSPNAQAAAQAVRDMAPALENLRAQVQDAFFQDFDSVLNNIAASLLGPVTDSMTSVATAINGVVQGLGEVAASQEAIDFVNSSFATTETIVNNLADPVANLFDAVLSVGNAINEAFGENAGAGLAGLVQQFADFLDEAAASGQAVEWVNDALDVFRLLGDILSPIVGILGSIGQAAEDTGGSVLGGLGTALGVFDDFLASAEGMDTLTSIFEIFNTVGAALGDILAGIGPALPPLIDGINELVQAVAPLIAPIAALVGQLAGALAPILGAVAKALQPLIPPLIRIVELIGGLLVDAINILMPVIEPLLNVFSGLLLAALLVIEPLLAELAPLFLDILEAVVPLVEALLPLITLTAGLATDLGEQLIPLVTLLAETFVLLANEVILPILIPILEFLVNIIAVVLPVALELLSSVIGAVISVAITAFTDMRDMVVSNVNAIKDSWSAFVDDLETGWSVIKNSVFTPLKNGAIGVKDSVVSAIGGMKTTWDGFVSYIKGIPGRISGSLSNLFSPLASGFRSAINSVIDGWNSLSFTVPSIDLGVLGSVGGFTVSTPNIPRLQVGGMSMGEGIAYLDPNEAILPLEDSRTTELLAGAIQRAFDRLNLGGGTDGSDGDITVIVQIGERDITDIVDTRIEVSNQTMMRRARAGTRRI